ncbi:MAG: J domain-containing protein [Oscillospiraceae bacterium]|nr:J domain-containing protein [Oscillospiraceae bacterium]
MKWFTNVHTVEELRKQYRQLMKKHHPDVGGNTEDAKQINAEYERLFAILSHQEAQERPQGEQDTTEDKAAEDKAIRAVLDALAGIDADVEIIGSWVWVTRNSFPYKELLKSLNFRYASKKKAWYFHADEYRRRSKREVTLDEIRAKYGSERVNNHRERKAVAG